MIDPLKTESSSLDDLRPGLPSPDEIAPQHPEPSDMDRHDNNPLYDTVADQQEVFGLGESGEPMMASNLNSVFRKGLKDMSEAVPNILESKLDMSEEAVARNTEFLERNKIDIELPDKAGNINLEHLDAPDKVNQVIVDLAAMMPDKMEKARGGVQSWDQTKMLADELGLTPQQLLDRKQGDAWNAQSIYAARMMLAQARNDISGLATKINGKEASKTDLVEFRRMLSVYAGIQQQIHGMAAEAGRALNQFKIAAKEGDIRNKQIDAVLDVHGYASTERLSYLWGALDDPRQQALFAQKSHEAKGIDMVLEYWINSLLSAPSTHAVNIIGNSLTSMWSIPEKAAARGISMLLNDGAIAPSETTAQVWGMYKGAQDGLKLAWQVLKTREPTDPQSKIEARSHQAITKENVAGLINRARTQGGKAANWMLRRDTFSPEDIEMSGWAGRFADGLGSFIRLPGAALMAEDEFFKSIAYRMELNALAAREAFQEGLTGAEAAERISAILDNPPESMHVAAVDAGHYRTFTEKLGATSNIQRFLAEAPVFRFIMPFVRTPINITKYSFERIPGLNMMVKRSRQELFGGDPAARDVALGKLAMGSGFMVATMPFVSEHFDNSEAEFEITGAAPSGALGQQWKRNHQAYSLRFGDEWVAYNRLDPLGQMLGIMADSVRIMRGADEETLEEFSAAIVMAISNNLINKTYMSGVAEAFEVFTSFDEQKWQRWTKRMGTSLLVPNIVRRAETQIDPTVRLTDSIIEEFSARVPGASSEMPPMQNLWGEPIETRSLGPNFVSPIFNMKQKYSTIDKELDRLRYPVRMPRKMIGNVEMTNHQYADYVKLQGKTVVMNRGTQFADISITNMNMKEALTKLVTKSKQYREGTDSIDPPGMKVKMIRKMVEMYRQQAQFHLMKKHPDVLDSATVRKTREAEAAGYSPMDAGKMGLEYSATMRHDVFSNLQSRVVEE